MQHLGAARGPSSLDLIRVVGEDAEPLGTGNEGGISEELVSMHLERGILVVYRPGYLESTIGSWSGHYEVRRQRRGE